MSPRRPAMSLLRASGRVGRDFFERIGAARDAMPAPRGLVDRMEDLGREGLALDRIDAALRPFFLAPASLELRIESTWHGAFAPLWRVARPIFRWIGQLHLPLRDAVIRARTLALDPARDGRSDVRGVIREYDHGGVMQVMAYATWRDGQDRYMSAAFPFPPGVLCGVLRLDVIDANRTDGRACGARLTSVRSVARGEPVGVWFALRWGPAIPMPLREILDLWRADDPLAPEDLRGRVRADEAFVGRHEQRLFGWLVATHRYWFRGI